MDFRTTQGTEMRTSGSAALSYGATTHLTKESSGGGEKRRLGTIHNGTTTPTTTAFTATHQTLDHHHHPLQPHHLQSVPPSTRDLDPDWLGSATAPPLSAGSTKPKTPSNSNNNNNNVRYRECLKNHAANIGGNVFDGCGEFMPCGEEGTLEALKCAACECHRNFHRKEVDGETTMMPFGPGSRSRSIMLSPLQLPPPLPSPTSALHHHRHQKFSIVQPMSVAFGGESSSEDLNVVFDNADGGGGAVAPFSLSKKRFRTKFTAEQKVRMVEFAERVGWRIQKQDEEDVERFCEEVGVKRQVLRVWMHNNKNTALKKLQHNEHDITTTTSQLALESVAAAPAHHEQQPAQGGGGTDHT